MADTKIEKLAKAELDKTVKHDDEKHREEFNIIRNKKLPEGFVNPPLGDPDHLCLDLGGRYNPDWSQVNIQKVYDKQVDPQDFPLDGVTYQVKLDRWTDVPPGVVESLKSAVETVHDYQTKPGMIALGQHPEHKRIERRRFVYEVIKSA